MSNEAKVLETANDDIDEITSEQVADFLREHPDFFIEQEDVLCDLKLPHESGKAISLLERQVILLRQRGAEAREKLGTLLQNARNNDALFDTTSNLVLTLLRADSVTDAAQIALDLLGDHDNVDACELILSSDFTGPLGNAVRSETANTLASQFPDVFRLEKTHCGQLTTDQLDFLFPNLSEGINSTALMPIVEGEEIIGLLALGNRQENFFNVSLDTLFLDYIGRVIAAILLRFQQTDP